MTAKSRRRKFDKRRKSDEHPQPRRAQEASRPEEGVRVIRDVRLKSVSLVPEGEGFPGSYITLGEFEVPEAEVEGPFNDDLVPLNAVDPKDWGIDGAPEGFRFYVNDQEKELIDNGYREYQERQARRQEAVRTSGTSDSASAGGE